MTSVRPENDTSLPKPGPVPDGVGMPGWVKAFLVVVAMGVIVLVVALLSGGGHGPGQHVG